MQKRKTTTQNGYRWLRQGAPERDEHSALGSGGVVVDDAVFGVCDDSQVVVLGGVHGRQGVLEGGPGLEVDKSVEVAAWDLLGPACLVRLRVEQTLRYGTCRKFISDMITYG